MTGSEANEQFGQWVEQCRQQLERGAASNALAAWMLSEGVSSETAAAILRAAQTVPDRTAGAPAMEAAFPETPVIDAPAEATAAAAPAEPSVTPDNAAAVFAKAFGKPCQSADQQAETGPAASPEPGPGPAAAPASAAIPDQTLPPAQEGVESLAAAGGEAIAAAPPAAFEPRPVEPTVAEDLSGLPAASAPIQPAEIPANSPAVATTFSPEQPFEAAAPVPLAPSNLFGSPRAHTDAPPAAGIPDAAAEPDGLQAADSGASAVPDHTTQPSAPPEMPPDNINAADALPEPAREPDMDPAFSGDEGAPPDTMEEMDVGEAEIPVPDEPGAGLDDSDSPPALAEESFLPPDDAESDRLDESGDASSPSADRPEHDTLPGDGEPEHEMPAAPAEEEEEHKEEQEEQDSPYRDSLEDAASRMGMSLSDPLHEPPDESYEDFLSREQDREREAEPGDTPPKPAGKRVVDLREGAGHAATDLPGEGEMARALREASEAMPNAVSDDGPDAPEGELARMIREAERDAGDDADAVRATPADGAHEDPAEAVPESGSGPGAEPVSPVGAPGPTTEEDLLRVARELGISFRDEPGAGVEDDRELTRAARELGISFRDDLPDRAGPDPDDSIAKAARELGINFRDAEEPRTKKEKSLLARYWPILLMIAAAAVAMPLIGAATMFWAE